MPSVTSTPRAMVSSLAVLTMLTGYVSGLPINTEGPADIANTSVVTRYNAADVKALSGKMWKLDECPPGIQIRVGKKKLNKKSFYCTRSDAMKLSALLMGEELPDRVYVWCRTAALYNSLGTGHKVFDVTSLNMFEGDIILTRENVDTILAAFFPTGTLREKALDAARDYQRRNFRQRPKRKAVTNTLSFWDKAIIPFRFVEGFTAVQKEIIREAISLWEKNTCIRFNETQVESFPSTVYFTKGFGCWSFIGRQSNSQTITLGNNCFVGAGFVAHEIGHALGFHHEHTRPDRDRYVTIVQKNIQTSYEFKFLKSQPGSMRTHGIAYDYSSVMHYGSMITDAGSGGAFLTIGQDYMQSTLFLSRNLLTAPSILSEDFANNRGRAILTTDPEMQKVIGQRERVSFLDVKLANVAHCSDRCVGQSLEWLECKHGGYRNPNNCTSCVCPRGLAPPRCEGPAPGENAACGRQTLEASGSPQYFSSPGYNDTGFPAGGSCSWLIKTTKPGKQIKLQFTGKFNFTDDVYLCYDYVEIRYKGLSSPGPRFCGNDKPNKTFISNDEELLIITYAYKSSLGYQGFQVKYVEVGSSPETTATIATTTTTAGTLSPLEVKPLGKWSAWGVWSECNATCGLCGTQQRARICIGSGCIGPAKEVRKCGNTMCPVETFTEAKTCQRQAHQDCEWYENPCFEYFTCYVIAKKPRCCFGTPENGVCEISLQ